MHWDRERQERERNAYIKILEDNAKHSNFFKSKEKSTLASLKPYSWQWSLYTRNYSLLEYVNITWILKVIFVQITLYTRDNWLCVYNDKDYDQVLIICLTPYIIMRKSSQ